jgi:hypothetical protein
MYTSGIQDVVQLLHLHYLSRYLVISNSGGNIQHSPQTAAIIQIYAFYYKHAALRRIR